VLGNLESDGSELVVISVLDETEMVDGVKTPTGALRNCLVVTESSPLEPDDESYKRYAPKIGMIYDDGLELYKHGHRKKSERYIEFEITEEQMPEIARGVVYDLHPTGIIKEVKVEIRKTRAFYAIETFIDGEQWDAGEQMDWNMAVSALFPYQA
jgi:hypothetical protein